VKKRELEEQLDAAHAEIARLVHIGDLRKREMQQLWRLSGEMKRCQICHEPNARVYVRDSVGGAKYFCPGHVPPINGVDDVKKRERLELATVLRLAQDAHNTELAAAHTQRAIVEFDLAAAHAEIIRLRYQLASIGHVEEKTT